MVDKTKIVEGILNAKDSDELFDIEDTYMRKIRDNFYNELFEDLKVRKKIAELLEVDEESLNNALVINGEPPIDYFDDED